MARNLRRRVLRGDRANDVGEPITPAAGAELNEWNVAISSPSPNTVRRHAKLRREFFGGKQIICCNTLAHSNSSVSEKSRRPRARIKKERSRTMLETPYWALLARFAGRSSLCLHTADGYSVDRGAAVG